MKRIISLLLVFTLAFAMVIPAHASGATEETFIDLLALGVDERNTYLPGSTTYQWELNLPNSNFRYIDILFYSDAECLSVKPFNSTYWQLDLIPLGDNLYRAYGDNYAVGSLFRLNFTFASTCNFLTLISARGSNLSKQLFQLGGSWAGSNSIETSAWASGTFDGLNEVVIDQAAAGYAAYANYTYGYDMRFYPGINDAWKAYDKISFTLGFVGYSINSICAYIDGVDVIDSISYIENGSYFDLRKNINDQYHFESSNDWRYLVITLDLTKVQKTVDHYPVINIHGIYEPGNTGNALFNIGRCNGILLDLYDTDAFWLRRIFNNISTNFTGLIDKVELFRVNFFTVMGSLQTNLSTWLTDLGNYLGSKSDELSSVVSSKFSGLFTTLGDIYTVIYRKLDSIITGIDDLSSVVSNKFSELLTNLGILFTDLRNLISSKFGELFTNLGTIYTAIYRKLDSIISGSAQDNTNADGFNSEVDNQSSELDEMSSVMGSVEQPDISDVNLSLNGMANPSVITLTTTGISNALGNEIIIRVLLIAFTFSMVGFILYGKKG